MPARIRTLVDPRFPANLARRRTEADMSLRDLARLSHCSKSYLHDLETGRATPTRQIAGQLDRILNAGGGLASLVLDTPAGTTTGDDDRLSYTVEHPTRLDGAAVRILADVLAHQRRLDDHVPAPVMLSSAVSQWRAVQDLAVAARGPHAVQLHKVAAEWTQFLGWLRAEAGEFPEAVRLLVEAADQADAVDDGVMAAQAENFRGYIERQRGNPRGIVRHFLAAYHTPGASGLQRVGDAIQAAHGYALLDDRRTAVRLLGEASDLTEAAEREEAPPAAYWLTTTFSRMGLGLAYLALGDHAAGVDNLRAGLAGLPEDQRGAEWADEYRRALAAAGG